MKLEFSLTTEELREAAEASAAAHKRGWLWVAVVTSVPFTLWSILGPLPQAVPKESISNLELLRPFMPYFPMFLAILFTLKLVKQNQKASMHELLVIQGRKNRWLSAGALFSYLLMLALISVLAFYRRTFNNGATASRAPVAKIWGEWVFWLGSMAAIWIGIIRFKKKNQKAINSQLQKRTLEYSPKGITASENLTASTYQWPAIMRCVESDNLYLLFPNPRASVIIPKRAFASVADLESFRQFVREWDATKKHSNSPVAPN